MREVEKRWITRWTKKIKEKLRGTFLLKKKKLKLCLPFALHYLPGMSCLILQCKHVWSSMLNPVPEPCYKIFFLITIDSGKVVNKPIVTLSLNFQWLQESLISISITKVMPKMSKLV